MGFLIQIGYASWDVRTYFYDPSKGKAYEAAAIGLIPDKQK